MVKSVGAWSEAATVCPTSTLREITVPSMGEMIFVYLRLSSAWSSAAFACAMLATAVAHVGASSSRGPPRRCRSPRATSALLRRRASLARELRSACTTERAGLDEGGLGGEQLARACSTAAWKSAGSIVAMICPFFTSDSKSAKSASMRPETWLPTCTVTIADSVPVAVTFAAMAPRSTAAVS